LEPLQPHPTNHYGYHKSSERNPGSGPGDLEGPEDLEDLEDPGDLEDLEGPHGPGGPGRPKESSIGSCPSSKADVCSMGSLPPSSWAIEPKPSTSSMEYKPIYGLIEKSQGSLHP